ncbi:polysaccharide biosynthesis/export family protein [Megamonas hypermegale]|uniref:polysaccharide biosynthesis/export family protein n=1 Tax=Megamonas hypermegale TaxID=158847 RepID=UPI0026F0BDB2|nr:polysaccharide biosynthesis/export family protein [Megamonas hypermegale]
MYKKVIVTTAMLSMLATTGFAASQSESKTDDSFMYMGLNTVPVEIGAEDTDIFKPAAIKSLEDYNDHYRLYKYDTISVRIIGFRDAQGLDNIMIGTDGYVNLPYAGSVKLSGLTLEEAKAVLMQKFSKYLKIPDMSVMVTSYGPRKVQVLGEVNNPGTVELASDDMNVTNAISKAGWVTTYGRIKKAQVIRIIDGTMYIKEANIKNYIEKHDITQNLALEDGDIIFIPKSNKIDFHQDILPLLNVYNTYKAITD